ncbi:MAG: TonB-dependent receptor [Sphingopyxis sp.]
MAAHAEQPAPQESGETPDAAPSDPRTASEPGEIVVTARRRSERLQDVPITIAALPAETLAKQNITDTRDLQINVPSLTVGRSAKGGNGNYIALRGIGGNETLFGQDQTVGLYLNEVPLARQDGSNIGFYDIASVQILYGPQGTLFGRNTVAGAVTYTTERPSDSFEGYLKVEAGSYDHRRLTGAINIPVGETLALRVAGQLRRRDGFITELNSGRSLGSQHSEAVRGTLRWAPSDTVTNDLIVEYSRADQRDLGGLVYGAKAISAVPCTTGRQAACFYGPGAPSGAADPRYANWPTVAAALALNLSDGPVVALPTVPKSRDRALMITNITDWNLSDTVTLRNIAAYRNIKAYSQLTGAGLADPVSRLLARLEQKQYTEELQVQAKLFDRQVELTAGGFYFKETGTESSSSDSFVSALSLPIATSYGEIDNSSRSLYAQATYRPDWLPQASLTSGFRRTWDRRALTISSGTRTTTAFVDGSYDLGDQLNCSLLDANNVALPLSACSLTNSAKYAKSTYLVTLDYKLARDILVYGTISRGYRSGGFNVRELFLPSSFRPETVNNKEVGFKSRVSLGGVGVQLNANYWEMDYKDTQTVVIFSFGSPPRTGTRITNAASENLRGWEASLTLEPWRGASIGGFVGHVSGEFLQFDPGNGAPVQASRDAGAPAYSWGLNASQTIDLGSIGGELTVSGNYYYRDGATTTTITPARKGPSYDQANFRIEWARVADSNFDLAIFGRDILDSRGYIPNTSTNPFTGGLGVDFRPPAIYGAELTYNF